MTWLSIKILAYGPSRLKMKSQAITSAIGAAYGGSLGVTTTSGPGMALKAEAMGLAVMLEIRL
jgi:pyruvate/2-oxoacid:ferredoxin oxidoreductase alpha subunit